MCPDSCLHYMLFGGPKVKVGFSHHAVDLSAESCAVDKALCFMLDSKQEQPTKKRKTGRKSGGKDAKMSAVTFGSRLDLGKLVQCRALEIAWRVRRGIFVFSTCLTNPHCELRASSSLNVVLLVLHSSLGWSQPVGAPNWYLSALCAFSVDKWLWKPTKLHKSCDRVV